MHHNIQYLFSVISVVNIRRYLETRGWRLRAAEATERMYFERIFAGGEDPAIVWIWSSTEHKRFRHQIPNLIFSLTVLESRPALDIANDMFASVPDDSASEAVGAELAAPLVAETPAASAAPLEPERRKPTSEKWHRLIMRFAEQTDVTVAEEMVSDTVRVPAGDVVELVHGGGLSADLELETSPGALKAIFPFAGGVVLLQGVARPMVGQHWSALQIVNAELSVLEDQGDSKAAALLLDELGPILTRIDFELDVNAPINDHQQNLVLRQTALMAAALARRLPDTEPSQRLVWRASAKLLFPVGRRLELRSTAAGDLFRAAREDEELRPMQTLAWLKNRSFSVVG